MPLRLLLLALVGVGGFLAWSNRREIRRRVHQWTAESGPASAVGFGDPSRAAGARRRIAALRSARGDSLVLSSREVANLIAAGAAERVPGALDSVEVRLDQDDLEVRARVDTRQVPLSLGPLAGMVRDWEHLEAGGRVVFRRTGLAEWQVTRVRVRGVPLPRDLVEGALRRFTGRDEAGVVGVAIPATIGGLRVSPAGVVLYGLAPAGVAR